MKFVATEEVAAPIEAVWARVSDFDGFETRAAARAGPIERRPPGPASKGTVWEGRVEAMGKVRDARVTLERLDPEESLVARGVVEGVEVDCLVALEPLGSQRTRMVVTTEASGTGIAARLALKAASLKKASLDERYARRLADFAGSIEAGAPTA